jgi:hypothetical protein
MQAGMARTGGEPADLTEDLPATCDDVPRTGLARVMCQTICGASSGGQVDRGRGGVHDTA